MRKNSKSKYVILSFVFLVFGFILAYTYSQSSKDIPRIGTLTDRQYEKEEELRNKLVELQGENKDLQNELFIKQQKVLELEGALSKEEELFSELAKDLEKYRMYLGKVKVRGQGIEVMLDDAGYKMSKGNINDFIVHEHHVFQVVNELYIAGASAVAVNGQRINHDSYILCSGPVITVDGNQFAAPFIITAIGDAGVLESALTLSGGVRDQLVNDNVVVTIEKKKEITLEPRLGDTG